MRNDNWKEDEWIQVRHCTGCLEPMLLSDWLKGKKDARSVRWAGNLNIDGSPANEPGKQFCSNCNRQTERWHRAEEQKPYADNRQLRHLLIDIRKELGLSEADSPSTFDPYELGELMASIAGVPVKEKGAGRNLYDYLQSVKRDYILCNSGSKGSKGRIRFWSNNMSKTFDIITNRTERVTTIRWSYIIHLINQVFPEEGVNDWPLWMMTAYFGNAKMRIALEMHGLDVSFKEEHLYEAMIRFVFKGNPTVDDLLAFCSKTKHTELSKKHHWVLSPNVLFYSRQPMYASKWDFLYGFQKYFSDELILTETDYLLRVRGSQTKGQTESEVVSLGRYWFFNYMCRELNVQIDEEKFPENSSQEDLEQIINIGIEDLFMSDLRPNYRGVTGVWQIVPKIAALNGSTMLDVNYNKDAQIGITKIVKQLWPDYDMEENIWSRKEVGERRVHSFMRRVMEYFKHHYQYSDTLHIPTRTGKVAFYKHSGMPMKIDALCAALSYAIEVQGGYHYIIDNESSWQGQIPKCYNGNATTYLEYRQEQDAKCKRAIKRHGFSPIYIPISRDVTPVKGVHGTLPYWNRKYVTGNSTKSIGLAEFFDVQGREDVGDMIRQYHHDVVMKRAAASS